MADETITPAILISATYRVQIDEVEAFKALASRMAMAARERDGCRARQTRRADQGAGRAVRSGVLDAAASRDTRRSWPSKHSRTDGSAGP